MKKFFTIISLVILMLSNKVSAQITYLHTFPGPSSLTEALPIIINLGNDEYKYFYVDYEANQLRLFNLDFSPFATVNIPITLVDVQTYNIGYVTRGLFDCSDTSMFDYAIFPQDSRKNFYVYKQDGTLLFQKDSVNGPYCFGCYNGAYDVRPIVNTPSGAVLFLGVGDSSGYVTTVNVYSLCGKLPEGVMENDALSTQTFMTAYPNPTSGEIKFEFDLPSNYQNYELVIYDSSLKSLQTIKIAGTTKKYDADEKHLSSGLYFFTLRNENKVLQTGKFILNK